MRRARGDVGAGAVPTGRSAGAERPSRFERSARLWLRAYPRRWRRDRGDEVVGVLLELARAGAGESTEADVLRHGVGARTAVDLLRHGWATRLRERPPLHRWLAYVLLDVSLPPRYRPWASDEIDGALFVLRRVAMTWILVGGLVASGAVAWGMAVIPAAVTVMAYASPFGGLRRERARERHLLLEPGEPLVRGAYVAMGEPRRRVPTTWAAPRALALDAGVLAAALVAALAAPVGLVARPAEPSGIEIAVGPLGSTRWAVLAALAAIVAASYAWHRRVRAALAAQLADLPAQPHRTVERPGPGWDVALVVTLALVVAWAIGEVVGQWALSLSPFVGAFAATHLPRAVAMAAAARRVDHRTPDGTPLAWADLIVVAATRRPPVPDTPARVVRRWDGPTIPGQVVLGPRAYTGEDREPGDPFRLA
jgi:hypothetical protein